jgi:hypothetical protein
MDARFQPGGFLDCGWQLRVTPDELGQDMKDKSEPDGPSWGKQIASDSRLKKKKKK